MAPVTSTVTIAEALDIMGMTANQLAHEAGVNVRTVMRAMVPGEVGGNKFSTNYTCAEAIAAALGLHVHEIKWANGISYVGRPTQTGRPVSASHHHLQDELCPQHFLVLSASGQCGMCA